MQDKTPSPGGVPAFRISNTTQHLPQATKIERTAPEEDYSKRSEYLQQIGKWSKKYVGHFERAYAGRSLRAAVNAKCLCCTNCQRTEIKYCQVVQCPLWDYRPYQKRRQP